MAVVTVRPGETITVVGLDADPNAPRPEHPIMLPGMPGFGTIGGVHPSHPIWYPQPGPGNPPGSQPPVYPSHPIWYPQPGPGNPPGSQPPVYPSHPISLPGDPWWGDPKPTHPIYLPVPPIEPPPTEPPATDAGHWAWAWSPQLQRYVWVKVPGAGEAGPKA
jgi:hypothetical protein